VTVFEVEKSEATVTKRLEVFSKRYILEVKHDRTIHKRLTYTKNNTLENASKEKIKCHTSVAVFKALDDADCITGTVYF